MAGFGWNMRQGSNVHEFDNNHARKSFIPPTQIACRICNKVCFSTQSLINHIETHMANYETAAARRQNHELIHHANPNFQNKFTLQTPLPPPPPPLPPNPLIVPDSRSLLNQRPVPPTNLSLLTKKNMVFGPQLPRDLFGPQQPRDLSVPQRPGDRFVRQLQRDLFGQQAVHIHQRSCNNFTKPFIDQLQKKIPVIEIDDDNNGVYETEMLDLTLKL